MNLKLALFTGLILLNSCSPKENPTILFLGDSITFGGRYVDYIETAYRFQYGHQAPSIINLGLSSETISGLSENDHPFPRPDLKDRLHRVLDSIQPSHVIACYGMNCAIYHPFGEERFAAYQQGLNYLIQQTAVRDIKLSILTPPPYAKKGIVPDTIPNDYSYKVPYHDYNEVLKSYGHWLRSNDSITHVEVIDLRPALEAKIEMAYSKKDPIHPNPIGHAIIAETILKKWEMSVFPEVLATGIDRSGEDSLWVKMEDIFRQERMYFDRPLLNKLGHEHPYIHEMIKLDVETGRHKADSILAFIPSLLKP